LYATSTNAAEARVEIMTIHKSKGLEFDVVILPSLHRGGHRDDKTLLRWARLSGLDADGLVLAPPAAQGEEHDAIYRWLATLEKRRAELERGRLLYVAATRAKRELHLFGSARVNQKQEPTRPKQGTLLNLLWLQLEPLFADAALHHVPMVLSQESMPQRSLYRLPAAWQMPVLNNALMGHQDVPVINAEQQPEFDWVGETSRHVGTVVHAELERLMTLSPLEMQRWDAAARRPQLLVQLAELGIPDALREGAVTRVIQAISSTLKDTRGRWILGIDTAQAEAASELALTGVFGGRIVNSVIDRSFVDEAGVRWIVDFKTSIHEGGGRDAFLLSEAERYRPQLERYATLMKAWRPAQPIRTALYFPLMGEWLEL
jgi:ATP-dependent exoDNAse (exonuclease V) beta subunit